MSKGSVTYTECASYLHKAGNVSNGNVKYTEYIIYKKNADHQKQQPSLSLQVELAIHSISIVKLCYL